MSVSGRRLFSVARLRTALIDNPVATWPALAFTHSGALTQSVWERWRRVVLQAAAVWLVTRIAFIILTYFAVLLTTRSYDSGSLPIGPHALLETWNRWDSIWYINVASRGYWEPQATAFFPLYPLLVKFASFVLGTHWVAAALLVSNLGTLLAFVGFNMLIAQEDGPQAASWQSLRILAAYPLALFMFAGYTEGLFFGLVAFTLFFARRGNWKYAALTAFIAGLTRPTSAALALPLFWEYGRQSGWWNAAAWRQGQWRKTIFSQRFVGMLGVVGAVPAAFGVYMTYLWRSFGSPTIFLTEESANWCHISSSLWHTGHSVLIQVSSTPMWTYWQAHQLLDLVPLLAFAAITLVQIRRAPFMFTLYMVGLMYLSVANPIPCGFPDLLMSVGRYMLAAAPAFLVLSRWSREHTWLDALITSGGFMLQGVLITVLLSGGWLI